MHWIRSVHIANLAAQSDGCKEGGHHLSFKYMSGYAFVCFVIAASRSNPVPLCVKYSIPQVGYKGPPSATAAVTHSIKDEESCPAGVEGAGIGAGSVETEVDADSLAGKVIAGVGESAMTSEDIGESESGCAAVTAVDMHDSAQSLSQAVIGEPYHKYLVGFGRNPFGRFSLTAALNEKTGTHHASLLSHYYYKAGFESFHWSAIQL
jgi:hypothetical protein